MTSDAVDPTVAEALNLARNWQRLGRDLQECWFDIDSHLEHQAAIAVDVRVQGPIEGTRRNHGLVASRTHDLVTSLTEISSRCERDDPNNRQAFVDFLDATSRADTEKLADVLPQAISSREAVEGFPAELGGAVGEAQVPVYSLIHLHLAVLSRYLDRPKLVRRSLESVGALLLALGEDAASKIVPVALIKAVFAQAVSDFEREEARLTQMTMAFDRLYWLDDSLGALVTNCDVIEGVIRASDRSLQVAQARFDENVQWLIGTMRAAEQVQ